MITALATSAAATQAERGKSPPESRQQLASRAPCTSAHEAAHHGASLRAASPSPPNGHMHPRACTHVVIDATQTALLTDEAKWWLQGGRYLPVPGGFQLHLFLMKRENWRVVGMLTATLRLIRP